MPEIDWSTGGERVVFSPCRASLDLGFKTQSPRSGGSAGESRRDWPPGLPADLNFQSFCGQNKEEVGPLGKDLSSATVQRQDEGQTVKSHSGCYEPIASRPYSAIEIPFPDHDSPTKKSKRAKCGRFGVSVDRTRPDGLAVFGRPVGCFQPTGFSPFANILGEASISLSGLLRQVGYFWARLVVEVAPLGMVGSSPSVLGGWGVQKKMPGRPGGDPNARAMEVCVSFRSPLIGDDPPEASHGPKTEKANDRSCKSF